jgi:hypothetical protein
MEHPTLDRVETTNTNSQTNFDAAKYIFICPSYIYLKEKIIS